MATPAPITVMKEQSIAASASADARVVRLSDFGNNLTGKYGLQVTNSGTGTLKVQLFLSNDGETWTVQGDGDIVATKAAGTAIYELTPEPLVYMKLVATEDGAANATVVTLILSVF